MDLHLKGKRIMVTGGGSGIGKSIVRTLVDEGAIPIIADRSAERLESIKSEITQRGRKCFPIQADLSTADQCKSVVHSCVREFGAIEGVVNNAGSNDGVGLEEGSPEQFRVSVSGNLNHYYDIVHYSLPYLKESQGPIVNIASKTAVTGQGGTSGYAAAKGAQLALTREWAVELLKYGIRVNAILPSEVWTPMYEEWVKKFDDPDAKVEEINKRIPLENRMTRPEEIADIAVFLLSSRASHITGQLHFVDGGYVHLDRALSFLA